MGSAARTAIWAMLTSAWNKAFELCQKSLNIALEVGDRAGEGRAYCNLGGAYGTGQFDKAVEFQQKYKRMK